MSSTWGKAYGRAWDRSVNNNNTVIIAVVSFMQLEVQIELLSC